MSPNYQPTLTQIVIYPIKSLDGKIVDRARISAGGALEFDRRWAIIDTNGKVVNAKRTAKIQQIRSQFEFVGSEQQLLIRLQTGNDSAIDTFYLDSDRTDLTKCLSEFFGFAVNLIENNVVGFPDDLAAYGPTVISTATLERVYDWFPDLDLTEVRRRFRTNLEISGVPAFWEDRLFAEAGTLVDFQLGDVRFCGINPCQRCIVPTRNSLTGNISPKFQQIFSQQRQQSLSTSVDRSRFNHFYKLAVNTQINRSEAGKFLIADDLLTLIEREWYWG